MVAPALPTIADEFGIRSEIEQYLVMSIFLLAYAIGPFVLAPLSEIYGRVIVLQLANLFYLVFNTACGFANSRSQILAFRFLSGLGGSAPQAVWSIFKLYPARKLLTVIRIARRRRPQRLLAGGGTKHGYSNLQRSSFPRSCRWTNRSVRVFFVLSTKQSVLREETAGGYLAQYMSWRWIFWIVSMADALVQLLAFVFLQETYSPRILAVKRNKLRQKTGNKLLHTEWDRPDRTFGQILRKNLVRPFIMLFTQPVIQALALYRAYQYGLMYLVYVSSPDRIPFVTVSHVCFFFIDWHPSLWCGRTRTTKIKAQQV